MKVKSILTGISFIIIFFIVVNLIPGSGRTNYKFDNYKKTIDSAISGTVKRIVRGKNFLGAQFGLDSNNYFGFTYYAEGTPKQWIKEYPNELIIIGDSVVKKANNDTFFIIRESNVWMYILPKDSALGKRNKE